MGVRVAWTVMLVYAFTVAMPFIMVMFPSGRTVPDELLDIIKSNKSTVDLITTAVVMFYFGASVQRKKDQDALATSIQTADTLAKTAQVAGAALSTNESLVIPPGASATATATPQGTIVEMDATTKPKAEDDGT